MLPEGYYFLDELTSDEKRDIDSLDVRNVSDTQIQVTPRMLAHFGVSCIQKSIDSYLNMAQKEMECDEKILEQDRVTYLTQVLVRILSSECIFPHYKKIIMSLEKCFNVMMEDIEDTKNDS